jgi:hypothetical protein
MGDLPAARELQEKVVEVRTRVLGPEHPNILSSINNLATTLLSMGDLPAARELQEKVVDVFTRVLGPEHPQTSSSMQWLGHHPVPNRAHVSSCRASRGGGEHAHQGAGL